MVTPTFRIMSMVPEDRIHPCHVLYCTRPALNRVRVEKTIKATTTTTWRLCNEHAADAVQINGRS